jgi:hypothetical protein
MAKRPVSKGKGKKKDQSQLLQLELTAAAEEAVDPCTGSIICESALSLLSDMLRYLFIIKTLHMKKISDCLSYTLIMVSQQRTAPYGDSRCRLNLVHASKALIERQHSEFTVPVSLLLSLLTKIMSKESGFTERNEVQKVLASINLHPTSQPFVRRLSNDTTNQIEIIPVIQPKSTLNKLNGTIACIAKSMPVPEQKPPTVPPQIDKNDNHVKLNVSIPMEDEELKSANEQVDFQTHTSPDSVTNRRQSSGVANRILSMIDLGAKSSDGIDIQEHTLVQNETSPKTNQDMKDQLPQRSNFVQQGSGKISKSTDSKPQNSIAQSLTQPISSTTKPTASQIGQGNAITQHAMPHHQSLPLNSHLKPNSSEPNSQQNKVDSQLLSSMPQQQPTKRALASPPQTKRHLGGSRLPPDQMYPTALLASPQQQQRLGSPQQKLQSRSTSNSNSPHQSADVIELSDDEDGQTKEHRKRKAVVDMENIHASKQVIVEDDDDVEGILGCFVDVDADL